MISGWPRTTSRRDARSSPKRVDPCRIARARLEQQEPELIPAHTGDQAVAPDIGAEDPTDNAQDLVAGVVPMGVVNPL